MNILVVGAGYVGLNTGATLAYLGHAVTFLDTDLERIATLRAGRMPIYEPTLDTLLDLARDRVAYRDAWEDGLAGADVVMLAVGTPPAEDGSPILDYVESAARQVAAHLKAGQEVVVVNKSTVPVGMADRVTHVIGRELLRRGVEARVGVGANPEFLREGTAIFDSFFPDRIIVGAHEDWVVRRLEAMYRPLIAGGHPLPDFVGGGEATRPTPFLVMSPTSAELTKYAANAFLATKISYINEIAALCDRVGARIDEVAEGIGTDRRIGRGFLRAGLGWGGSCFPKDTAALCQIGREHGVEMRIVTTAREVNEHQRHVVVGKLQTHLKVLRGKTVAVLGLTFKPETDDVRDSPALEVCRLLVERGVQVRAYDPMGIGNAQAAFEHPDLAYAENALAACEGADAVVLATDWPEFAALDWQAVSTRLRGRLVLDARNLLEPDAVESSGLLHVAIGR